MAVPPSQFIRQHVASLSLFTMSLFLFLAAVFNSIDNESSTGQQARRTSASSEIPNNLLSSFGSYPNLLNLTEADRASFHPVVIFPQVSIDVGTLDEDVLIVDNLQVMDFTRPTGQRQLATEQERLDRRQRGNHRQGRDDGGDALSHSSFAVGRYDEDRAGMYDSELFDDLDNSIDSYKGRRTIHMGIDLDGPVGTKVYAFCDGRVHAAGYNPELGDYGNVLVVEHDLPGKEPRRKVYALYGHLQGVRGMSVGKRIRKGKVLGRMGDIHENGGWFIPHVHFQLSVHAPKTHDMPGAVSGGDRKRALLEYPDPRYIVGALY